MIRSALQHCNPNPKLCVSLFDKLAKPILLYCSEIWGAFGVKHTKHINLLLSLLTNDKTPYEKLNLKMCKHTLRVPKQASNLAARAELGRIPIAKSIIVAIIKYYARFKNINHNEPLYHAFNSQNSLIKNSYNTMSYPYLARRLMVQLEIPQLTNQYMSCISTNPKNHIITIGIRAKKSCISYYKEYISNTLSNIRLNSDSKLTLYSFIKKDYLYENYLDSKHQFISELTKFRISNHQLPIELGRHQRIKIPRHLRICTLCKQNVGNEFHALMSCQNNIAIESRNLYLGKFNLVVPEWNTMSTMQKFLYITQGHELIVKDMCDWINLVNQWYKKAKNN